MASLGRHRRAGHRASPPRRAKPGQDFFPLTVDYQEKTYAAGKIPGGFFKREGRPSEKETLTSRLIDRPIRPLFPDGFYNEVQVVATVMSVDPEIDPDIPAMIGASAALALSGIPFDGPIGAARVGYINGQYVLNPTETELDDSQLNLVVAGTEAAVLMVESEAHELPEEVMLGAVVFGHQQMQAAIEPSTSWSRKAASRCGTGSRAAKDEALIARVTAAVRSRPARGLPDRGRSRRASRRSKRDLQARSRRVGLRRGRSPDVARTRSATSCSTSKRRSCAARSWTASRASTAATRAPCARSPSAPACCRAPTARRCSRAARRRRWSSPRSAPPATSRSSTR